MFFTHPHVPLPHLSFSLAGMIIIGSVLLLLSLVCFIALGVYNRRSDDRWYLRIDDDA